MQLTRTRVGVIYALFYLVIGAVISRMVPNYIGTPYQWSVIGLLAVYVALITTERFISSKAGWYLPVYFIAQSAITLILLLIPSDTAPKDYFVNLILPLCAQAIWGMPERKAIGWVGYCCLFCAASMVLYYRSWEGVGFGLSYIAGGLLVSILSAMTLRADRARSESLAAQAELRIANQKLQDYTRQVEALAAAEERNRLARELHDSVSQTIFSMTLTTQATRILLDREPTRVAGLLDHLQSLSQNALTEMRTLILELRPHSLVENGLAAALRKHAAERLTRDGLQVDIQVKGESRLPDTVEEGLFRVVQEALNNVVKHARTDRAEVILDMSGKSASLLVQDHGIGFDPDTAQAQAGHMGMASMEERVRSLGGTLAIESAPGKGTRIRINNIPLEATLVTQTGTRVDQEGGFDG